MTAPQLATPHAAHVRSDLDLSTGATVRILDLATRMKRAPAKFSKTLAGRYLSLVFEKPSLRTRLTFELAIKQLGGDAVTTSGPLGDREPVQDIARNLDRWTHAVAARVFRQETVEELARYSSVPVINALSDMFHPCQALADAQTLKERFGRWEGLKLAFIGDGNNVAHSLMLTLGRLGVEVTVCTPKGYEPNDEVAEAARKLGKLNLTHDPKEAAAGAHAVYTDVWASMGQEGEAKQRRVDFKSYQVTEAVMSLARPDAVFMHCLPAHRGEEVAGAVIESPRSVVFDQAENRLHAQKALLLERIGAKTNL